MMRWSKNKFFLALAVFAIVSLSSLAFANYTLSTISWTTSQSTPLLEMIKENLEKRLGAYEDYDLLVDTVTDELKQYERAGLPYLFQPEFKTKGESVALHVTANPAKKIRSIQFHGNYPLLSRKILHQMTLQPGSIVTESALRESSDRIRNYFISHGYNDTVVTITQENLAHNDAVERLDVRIKKGPRYKINTITIEGQTHLSRKKVAQVFHEKQYYKERRTKNDVKRLKKILIDRGYLKAQVSLTAVNFNPEQKTVDLIISVRDNKTVDIDFRGYQTVSLKSLKRHAGIDRMLSFDNLSLERSRKQLEDTLKNRGYRQARVTTITENKPDKIKIIYDVKEGVRSQVNSISYKNNHNLSDKRIKKEMIVKESTFLNPHYMQEQALQRDQIRIVDLYKTNGFFDVRLSPAEMTSNKFGDQIDIQFEVDEGEPYRIETITYDAPPFISKRFLLKNSKVKKRRQYVQDDVEKTKGNILNELNRQGYAYASVDALTTVNHDTHRVSITFHIAPGKKVTVRRILFEGLDRTRLSSLKKHVKLIEGHPYSETLLNESMNNLRQMGVFSSIQNFVLGLEHESAQVDIVFAVIERNTVNLDAQVGFDSRNLVTGEVSLTKYNLFGTAKQLNTRIIGGPQYSRGEVTFIAPRIFGASWNLANQLFAQYQDEPNFNATSYGSYVSTYKGFGSHYSLSLKEQVSHTNLDEANSNPDLAGALFDNTLNEIQVTHYFDFRDNYSDPQRGFYAVQKNTLSTDLNQISDNFVTSESSFSHFLGFWRRLVFVNALRFGQINTLNGNPTVPANKLFFLGGADTLRGFEDDAIKSSGGTSQGIYNFEIQFGVSQDLRLASFFDAGFLTNDMNTLKIDDIRESVGVGLRYFTPLGPLRLDLGFPLDRKDSEPTQQLHFSFGYYF